MKRGGGGMRIRTDSGYSLLEFILVVILISIMAAIILPRFAQRSMSRQKVYAVAHNIASDLRAAQKYNIGQGLNGASGKSYWFKLYTVGTATDTFRIFEQNNEANPMRTYTVPGSDIVIKGNATDSYYFNTRGEPRPVNGSSISVSDRDGMYQWNVVVVKTTGRVELVQVK
jgi:prepilin-type N-terminal cleavage/methylation domain-containing protein